MCYRPGDAAARISDRLTMRRVDALSRHRTAHLYCRISTSSCAIGQGAMKKTALRRDTRLGLRRFRPDTRSQGAFGRASRSFRSACGPYEITPLETRFHALSLSPLRT